MIQALTERIRMSTLEREPAESDPNAIQEFQSQNKLDERDNWKPLGSLPGITTTQIIPPKKANLEQLIRTLDRNCKNLHIKRDFSDESALSKPKVEPTLRQKKILNNLILAVNRMTDKRKTDALRDYYTLNFRRTSLPGEKSVPLSTFRHECRKQSASTLIPGQSLGNLKQNIVQSEMNLKKINSGKRMSIVLMTQTDLSKSKNEDEGLPVFRNRHYSSDL